MAEITRSSAPTTTVVLRARTQAEVLEPTQWAQCRKWTGPADIKKFLKEQRADLHIEDIFRVQIDPKEATFLIRVHSRQEREWLRAEQMPLSFSPTGEGLQKFRVVWDRETGTLQALQKKYAHLEGFSGPVLSTRGLGARFQEEKYQQAREKAGLAIGQAYLITGLQVENSEQDVIDLMKECSWTVQPIPGSKRIKGRMSQVKVRAVQAPPRTVIRITTGREISTVYIQEQQPQQPKTVQKPATAQSPSRTWAEAVRTALGREQHVEPVEPNQMPNRTSTPFPQGPRKRTPWADQEEEDVEDHEMDSRDDTESEESFVPWDLFEEQQQHIDINDDQHVEAGPARKRQRRAVKKCSTQQKGKRLKMLEQGLLAVQTQMGELTGVLQRQQGVHVRTGPLRGTMTWPEGLTLPDETITRVPGDGDCLWHSLAVSKAGIEAAQTLPGSGQVFKAEYLEWLRNHQKEAVDLWGCGEEAIPGIIETWQKDWADGRALLLASYLAGVTILLFNQHDRRVEVFHAGETQALMGPVWAVVFNGSHYDSLRSPGQDDVAKVRASIPLIPWKHSSRQPLRGGSAMHPRMAFRGPLQKIGNS